MTTQNQPVSIFQKILEFPLVQLVIGMVWMSVAGMLPGLLYHVELDDTLTLANALIGLTSFVGIQFLGYYAYVRIVERRPVTELSFSGAVLEVASGIMIGLVLFTTIIGLLWLLGFYHSNGVNGWHALLLPFIIAVVSGVGEEIRYRMIGFRLIEKWLGSGLALLISALYFGISHIGNPNATLYTSLAIALEGGILLAAAYMVTRRLWLVIGIHTAWNFAQAGIFGVAVSGFEITGLLQGTLSGPWLLSGGEFGAEGSIFALILCLLVASVFLWRAYTQGSFVKPFWQRRPSSA